MCGWALRSLGLPCVAQRVWPMPAMPWSGYSQQHGSRLRSLPSRGDAPDAHRARSRFPTNHSRDIPAAGGASTRPSATGVLPRIPIIPHMIGPTSSRGSHSLPQLLAIALCTGSGRKIQIKRDLQTIFNGCRPLLPVTRAEPRAAQPGSCFSSPRSQRQGFGSMCRA